MRREQTLVRQHDLIPARALATPITVIGAGAVGSFAVVALAKSGFADIHVYDDDTLGPENLNCQFYKWADVGRPKVDALADIVREFAGVDITTHRRRVTRNDTLRSGVVITAVDSITVRSELWCAVLGSIRTELLIDPRMGAEAVSVYAIRPRDTGHRQMYETTLHPQDESVRAPCTAKSTAYTALIIAGYVTKLVKDWVTTSAATRSMHLNIKHWDTESYA